MSNIGMWRHNVSSKHVFCNQRNDVSRKRRVQCITDIRGEGEAAKMAKAYLGISVSLQRRDVESTGG